MMLQSDYLKYDDILEFLGVGTSDSEPNAKQLFHEAILYYLHWLCHYEEEDRRIKYDLVVGIDVDLDDADCSYVRLISVDADGATEMKDKVKEVLKKSIPICEDSFGVFVCLNSHTKQLTAGIISYELGLCEQTKKSLLEGGFILYQHLFDTTIMIQTERKCRAVSFSFGDRMLLSTDSVRPTHDTYIRKYWSDLFNRIRRSVHGTICLIVLPEWKATEDDNFAKKDNQKGNGRIVELPSGDLKLNLIPVDYESSSRSDISRLSNAISVFISMLKYDGITVLDTNGYIRAYNGICNLHDDNNHGQIGGARHHAFDQLQRSKNKNYVGVYMQTQEGEVDFYSFCTMNSMGFFDPSVMKLSETQRLKEIKEVRSRVMNSCKDIELFKMLDAAKSLRDTHNEFYNFYNEPDKAHELLAEIEAVKDNLNEEYIKSNKLVFKSTMNALLLCYVGNEYGYSFEAQKDIRTALSYFKDYWKLYFDEKFYYDENLAQTFIYSKNSFERWGEFFKSKSISLNQLERDDCYEILSGFRALRLEMEEEQSRE